MSNSFLIYTLGCKVNSYESQAIREILKSANYYESTSPSIVIINTCAVTKMAEHKSRQKVSSFAKKYPNSIIVVCGCSSNIHAEDYLKIPGVKIVLGNNNHSEILNLINKYNETFKPIIELDHPIRKREFQNLNISSFEEKVRAFVKISDGCNNFCSYCIIPLNRGNLRSRKKDDIINEIKRLICNGYQEIVITGIDSASYESENEEYHFNDLLQDILKIDNLKRLRISSIEASQIDDRFISILKNNPNIAQHLHIPLQSGSDSVLKRMNRKYSCDEFYQKIKRITQELPLIALACDIIVGFPQETEEEFLETLEFVKKCGFAFLHVFPYSPREGTLASKMPHQVNDQIKKERVKRLIALGQSLTEKYQNKFINKELNVLIENYDNQKQMYHGLSDNYLDCYVKSSKSIVNTFVKVKYQGRN